MYCKRCGNEVNEGEICPYCGEKADSTQERSFGSDPAPAGKSSRNRLAIIALIFAFIPGLCIIAIILGIIALKSNRKPLAIVSIIVAGMETLFSIILAGFIIPTTIAVFNRGKKNDAEKKANSVLYTAKSVLSEASFSNDTMGGYVTIVGSEYSITVTSLKNMGEITSNPFENGGSDGGMTVIYNSTNGSYLCDISGTINGYTISYDGSFLKASK